MSLVGNIWPRTYLLGWASPHKCPPKRLSLPPQHPRGEGTPRPSWGHPPSTPSPHSWTQLSQTSHRPQTPQSPKPKHPITRCVASPEQTPPQQPPARLPPRAAASPLHYCQRVASASVCKINSEVERENYVKCGYSGAAGEARLMAKCLFVCLICIFFQRCIFRRVICCLFRPRSVSFLRQ